MYTKDVKAITNYVKTNGPDGLAHVAYCVIGSIRTQFPSLVGITKSIKEEGSDSKQVWGSKKDAYATVTQSKHLWYDKLITNRLSERSAMIMIAETKGIGLAKSGFLLQMLGYNTACLDVHNLNALGIKNTYFSNPKRCSEYLDIVQEKGTEYWWDTWCGFIYEKGNDKHFSSAEEVSKFHVTAIKG